jgi:hypothetical protein
MSFTIFGLPPSSFVKHDDVRIAGTTLDSRKARKQKPNRKDFRETEAALLREDHIVLLAIDGLLALHAAIKSGADSLSEWFHLKSLAPRARVSCCFTLRAGSEVSATDLRSLSCRHICRRSALARVKLV